MQVIPGPPVCLSLLASPPNPVAAGTSVTLTASCSNNPTTYTWTANGLPAGTTTVPSLSVAPTQTTTYAVRASNASGTSAVPQSVIVVVLNPPACLSLLASPPNPVAAGTSVTLTASCSNNPTTFTWTANGLPAGTTTVPTLPVTPAQTTTYTVTASNASGTSAVPQSVIVVVPSNVSAVSGTPQFGNPGQPLADPLIVLVQDAHGNPIAGAGSQLVASSTVSSDVISAPSDVVGRPGQYSYSVALGTSTATRTIKVCLSVTPNQCAAFTVSTRQEVVERPAKQLIAPQELAALTSATQQLSNLNKWLNIHRTLRNPTVTQGLKVSIDGQALPPMSAFALAPTAKDGKPVPQTGGGASAEPDPFERWGGFVQGDLDIGKVAGSSTQTGFDIHTWGLTLGTDYRFTGNHVLGAALGLVKANTDLNDNAGDQNTKGWSISVFGEYVPVENAYLDLIVNYGRNQYDTTRRVVGAVQPSPAIEFASSPHGNQFAAAFSAGYQFYQQAWTLNPYGRIEYVNASIDSFQESGGAGALQVSSQRYKRTVLTAGGQVQYAWSMAWGVLVPYARAEFQYATQASDKPVTAQLVAVPTSGLILQLNGADKHYGNLAVGATAVLPRGVSGYFNYEYVFGNGQFDENRYTLGIRVDF